MIGSASSALVTGFRDGGFGVGDRRRVVPACLWNPRRDGWSRCDGTRASFEWPTARNARRDGPPALSTGGPCRVQA
jgi:hypothetical protein